MPIYDSDGSTSRQIARLWDNNGTTSSQISKVWDNDGTTSRLVYAAVVTIQNSFTYVDDMTFTWQDVGDTYYYKKTATFYAVAGHRYVVQARLDGWAYSGGSECRVIWEVQIDRKISVVGHYGTNFNKFSYTDSCIYTATSTGTKDIEGYVKRYMSTQGELSGEVLMVVDVTELENMRGTQFGSAQEFIDKYGTFTGSKEVEV